MDSLSRQLCRVRDGMLMLGVIAVAAFGEARAQVINDGTTTNGLVRLANLEETAFGNITALRVGPSNSLVAEQIDLENFLSPFPALRTAWYPTSANATSAAYRVSAEYRPDALNPANQGGVIGWLNGSSNNGIVLKTVPGSGGASLPFSFQLSHVNFNGTTPADNENYDFLYDLDGTNALGSFESAWSEPTDYAASEFARFEIEFSLPTAEDLEAVSNATARVTARIYQGAVGGTPTQVGRSIELLTTLPVPASTNHRFGYFGVWSSFLTGNHVIGEYRNLVAEGTIDFNQPPTINWIRPTPGTTLTAPATFLLEVNATDPDGSITNVQFFEGGTNSLGSAMTSPYTWSWAGVAEGDYVLTAVATDNKGVSTTSEPVTVTVSQQSGTAPVLDVQVAGETLQLSWSGTGFQLQYKLSLDDPAWIDVPNTTGLSQIELPTSLGAQYFRLLGSGDPSGPALSATVSADRITVSWPAGTTGYRLQSNSGLEDAGWIDVQTTGTSYSEPISGAARFYRLIQ